MTPLVGLVLCVVFVWVVFAVAMVAHLRRHALPLVPHYDHLDSDDYDTIFQRMLDDERPESM